VYIDIFIDLSTLPGLPQLPADARAKVRYPNKIIQSVGSETAGLALARFSSSLLFITFCLLSLNPLADLPPSSPPG
jgi:hypothetical protein